jgi:hypothetical protein
MGKEVLEKPENKEEVVDQGNLSDAQEEALRKEVLADFEKEEGGEHKEHEEQKEEKTDEEKEQEKIEKEAAEKAEKEGEVKELPERAKELGLPETATKEEVEAKEKEIADKKIEEDKKLETQKKEEEFTKEAEDYAKEAKITVDAAREELKSRDAIREKYKDDQKQLAQANLHLQRLYTKTAEELKSLREALPAQQEVTVDGVIKALDDGKFKVKGKAVTREMAIEAYRQNYPDITAEVDDEKVLRMAAKDMKSHIEAQQKDYLANLTVQAKEKKDKVLSELSDADKQFLPELKPILDNLNARQIMSDDFSIGDLVLWAKGKKFEDAVKEAEERGFKRGSEQKKIIAEKAPEGTGSQKPKTGTKKALTKAQEERAIEMFDGLGLTNEQMFDNYRDYLKDEEEENKRNKNK